MKGKFAMACVVSAVVATAFLLRDDGDADLAILRGVKPIGETAKPYWGTWRDQEDQITRFYTLRMHYDDAVNRTADELKVPKWRHNNAYPQSEFWCESPYQTITIFRGGMTAMVENTWHEPSEEKAREWVTISVARNKTWKQKAIVFLRERLLKKHPREVWYPIDTPKPSQDTIRRGIHVDPRKGTKNIEGKEITSMYYALNVDENS